ncbi:MAG: CapA family protein [Candidatus Onthomonas sp.]
MEERRRSRHSQRRPARRRRKLNPGFVLCSVCSVLIVICLFIGGIQHLVAQGEAKEQAAREAAEQAAREEEERLAAEAAAAAEAAKYDFTISFMGDVNLDDSWSTMNYLAQQPNGISDCFDPALLEKMQSADLFCINSEFAFTDGGTPLDGKSYTFRSKPSNVSIYQTMGVDLVSLANNHVYDFGAQGLTDTLKTLDDAGIAHVGAGETLADASAPYYCEIQGVTVAFVNASCAEQHRFTPEATEDSSGILLCYETDKFLQAIREAKSNADYVIALVHWGTDYVYETSDSQRSTAHDYIIAGADAVVGTHSHCLQGIEYFNDKPIFYSLGSCWFNDKTLETFLLELRFTGDGNGGEMSATIVPAIQKSCTTSLTQSPEEWQQVVDLILQYSTDVHIGSDGLLGQGPAPAETPADDSADLPEESGDTQSALEDGSGDVAPDSSAEDGEAAG